LDVPAIGDAPVVATVGYEPEPADWAISFSDNQDDDEHTTK
jgi:hypothetical protein